MKISVIFKENIGTLYTDALSDTLEDPLELHALGLANTAILDNEGDQRILNLILQETATLPPPKDRVHELLNIVDLAADEVTKEQAFEQATLAVGQRLQRFSPDAYMIATQPSAATKGMQLGA